MPPITRRTFLGSSAAGAASVLFARQASCEQWPRPNILFFLTDDQRADILGCAGHPILKTPAIDGIAARGVRFSNAFVTTPICAASRASILTGLHERTHGYTFGTAPLDASLAKASYPARLREAGYRTAFFGKFGIDMDLPAAALFDESILRERPFRIDGRHIDELNADAAIQFLEAQSEAQPFCLSVSFSSSHADDGNFEDHYPCIDAVKGMYEGMEMPLPRLSDPSIFEAHPQFLRESLNRVRYFWRWDTPEKYQKNMRAYFRMLSGVDLLIGRVLEALEKKGLAEKTVVVYAGDNGYYMAERGFAGKWSHYEESLRIPLIIHDPRLPKGFEGQVCDAIALNIDLAPTFLDLAKLKVPADYQGKSLKTWCYGEEPEGWHHSFFCEHRMEHPQIPKWEGLRTRNAHYACYYEQQPPYEFLHDVMADPDALTNLAGDPSHAGLLARMRAECTAASAALLKQRPPKKETAG
jgi:arylsulfatase A-like enzyme